MNNATLSVMMVIDNDREALGAALDIARANNQNYIAVAQDLRNHFEPMVEDAANNLKRDIGGTLAVELIDSALAQIGWGALAAHYERKVKEGVTV